MTATCNDSDGDSDGNSGNDDDGNNNGDDGNDDDDSNCHGIAVLPMIKVPHLDLKHVGAVGMLIASLVVLPPGGKGKPPVLSLDGRCRWGHWSSGNKDLLAACVATNKEKTYHDNDGSSGSGAEKKERGSNGRWLWTIRTAWQLVVTVDF
jgi:hypothetical protein